MECKLGMHTSNLFNPDTIAERCVLMGYQCVMPPWDYSLCEDKIRRDYLFSSPGQTSVLCHASWILIPRHKARFSICMIQMGRERVVPSLCGLCAHAQCHLSLSSAVLTERNRCEPLTNNVLFFGSTALFSLTRFTL